MGRWVCIEEGTVDIAPRYKGDSIREHILPGTFPRRYWVIAEVDEDESVKVHIDDQARPRMGNCKRCNREIKPMYTYCYRCHNYLKVKERIAAA